MQSESLQKMKITTAKISSVSKLMVDVLKFHTLFFFLFSSKIKAIRAGIHKTLIGKANSGDPDQTASSEAVCSVSVLFILVFLIVNRCSKF